MSVRFTTRTFLFLALLFSWGCSTASRNHLVARFPASKGLSTDPWITVDPTDGTIAYRKTSRGDRIMDFSHAGYGGGGIPLPTPPATVILKPPAGGKDSTPAIQAAIDEISNLPLGSDGIRGVVQLSPGYFRLLGSLSVQASGVILRGSGSGQGGTQINLLGDPRTLIQLGPVSKPTILNGLSSRISDVYVPAGTRSFQVQDSSIFKVGDTVVVNRPVTAEWVKFMGMDKLVRNGAPESWLTPGTVSQFDRVITAISGQEVTIDAPLPDSLDSKFLGSSGASLAKYQFDERINQVGIESFRVVASTPQKLPLQFTDPLFKLAVVNSVQNAWIRDVVGDHFLEGLTLGRTSKWITIQDTSFIHAPAYNKTGALQAQYDLQGQFILLNRCASNGDNYFPIATSRFTNGPNVVLHFTVTSGQHTALEPHQRWATGLLFDNVSAPDAKIEFHNRGILGTGHGWTMGWGVVWNSNARAFELQQAPGTNTWVIGCSGVALPADQVIFPTEHSDPTIESWGKAVDPSSLYLAQLKARLGQEALKSLGY